MKKLIQYVCVCLGIVCTVILSSVWYWQQKLPNDYKVQKGNALSVSENIALWSFSPLSAISLLFLSLLLIFDLDNNRKICYHSTVKELN